MITSLLSLYFWEQHEVLEVKQKRNFKYQHNRIVTFTKNNRNTFQLEELEELKNSKKYQK